MKIRGFTVVLHDVHKGIQAKADVENKIKTMPFRQYVIAEEPYNHQEGSHIHIFIQLKNPIHFTSALKFWCTWWKSGRVQVDQMKGSMAQACKYILIDQSKKDKYFDPSPIIVLDQASANEVGVEAKTISIEDLISTHCWNLNCWIKYGTDSELCPHIRPLWDIYVSTLLPKKEKIKDIQNEI